MDEKDLRALLEQLFLHVAAMPWADEGFVRSEASKQAAKDQIIGITVTKIKELENATKEND